LHRDVGRKDSLRRPCHISSLKDFDRYVTEHGIPEDDYPAAFALWIVERTGGPVPRFERSSGRSRRTGL
jgi:hypothetical protein